jgi:hypothetical protein
LKADAARFARRNGHNHGTGSEAAPDSENVPRPAVEGPGPAQLTGSACKSQIVLGLGHILPCK